MGNRRLSNWLSAYLKYAENSEPPKSYHTWVGISLISAALQRRCWIKWGYETIYPNMYIVLIGPSGKCRKGTAMNIGKAIIGDIGIAMTSESTTREALIRDMKEAIGNFINPENNSMTFHCSLFCMSEELSVFLGQNDVKFLADLTDWYDSRDEWTYRTKGAGTDVIQGVCFNLLGATAPDWLQSIIPEEAVGGGFTSRVIFVVEENKGKTVPKHVLTEEEEILKQALYEDLGRIHNLTGPFRFDDNAEKRYIAWYEEVEGQAAKGNVPIDDPRFAGYCDRRATHLRKLCMVMSASRGDDMLLIEDDFDKALSVMTAAEVKMHKTFGGLGRSQYSAVTEKVLNYIISCKQVKRSVLMRAFYRDVDSGTLKIIEEVLQQMKVVKLSIDTGSGEVIYTYIGPK